MEFTLPMLAEYASLAIFVMAYAMVFAEEKLHLRKSMPVMMAASLVWILVAISFLGQGRQAEIAPELKRVMVEFAELMLFLLSAMSFVNAMIERKVFDALHSRLVAWRLSVRGIFWITGLCAFLLSPVADNLTTALVMGTVVVSTLSMDKKLIPPALVNIVVAANAGGAFSPFGDITTLMVWQAGKVHFTEFFALFLPALVNWLVPAVLISLTIPRQQAHSSTALVPIRRGGWGIIVLFLLTIAATILLDHLFHLPPFFGMMTGFGVLNLYGYLLHRVGRQRLDPVATSAHLLQDETEPHKHSFDAFAHLEKIEWDTLLFFYGIMLCVGGLSAIGGLAQLSHFLYNGLGATTANIAIGLLSAFLDNIPLTYAVLAMNPPLDTFQWLLVTLTAGVGGSLLSIGSAAGIAAMGIGKGRYTFLAHLKWSWAILLGYAASITVHFLLNQGHVLRHP